MNSAQISQEFVLAAAHEWQQKFKARRTTKPNQASLSALSGAHSSNWNDLYGVSRWTVARRRKAGVRPDDLFKPVAVSAAPLELDGEQYSATRFAKVFAISKADTLAGIRAGKTAEQILCERRKRGRPWPQK